MITEQEIESLVNKHLVDRVTATDDLLAMLLRTQYDNNLLLKRFVQMQGVDTEETFYQHIPKILPGNVGVSYVGGNADDTISCVINNIMTDAVCKGTIVAYEQIVVVPGGEENRPFVMPLSILIKGNKGVIAQDDDNNLVSKMYGSEDLPVAQKALTGELVSVMQGDQGIDIKQKAITGELLAEMQGSEGVAVKQQATGEMVAVMQGSQSADILQDATGALVALMKGVYAGTLTSIAVDVNGNMVAVMSGAYDGALTTIAVDETGKLIIDSGGFKYSTRSYDDIAGDLENYTFVGAIAKYLNDEFGVSDIAALFDSANVSAGKCAEYVNTVDLTTANSASIFEHVNLTAAKGASIFDSTNLTAAELISILDNANITSAKIKSIFETSLLSVDEKRAATLEGDQYTVTDAATSVNGAFYTDANLALAFDNANLTAAKGASIFDNANLTAAKGASIFDSINLTAAKAQSILSNTNLSITKCHSIGDNITRVFGMWISNCSSLAAARYYPAGCGTQTAGLSFGGEVTIATFPYLVNSAVTEEYDGAAWAAGGALATARKMLAGCGTQTAGLSLGG